jgi:quinol monooxygenase YgiN
MTFEENKCADFIALFDHYKNHIRQAEGCQGLRLLRCTDHPNVFFTYSQWLLEDNLESYRQSAIFAEVWPKTKAMFAAPAQAWTNDILFDLN